MTDNIIYNMDLPDESKYTNTCMHGFGTTCANTVNDKIRNENDSFLRARNETVVDNNTGTPVSSYVQNVDVVYSVENVDVTYSVVNKIKLRDTENNVDQPKRNEVEDSSNTYAAVSK